MKFLIIILLVFFNINLQAQETCIQLEGISIGCVPSQSHTCFLNKNIDISGGNGNCKYTKLEMTGVHFKAPRGAIAFECASPPVLETKCVRTGDKEICTTTSTCKEYSKPVCDEVCELCHKEVREEPSKAAGCIVCTRPRCQQEPKPTASCPTVSSKDSNFVLPKIDRPICGTVPTCQTSATDPNGVTHEVLIRRANCPELEMVKKMDDRVELGASCPWISDPISGINMDSPPAEVEKACNEAFPIKAPNRYPEDYTP